MHLRKKEEKLNQRGHIVAKCNKKSNKKLCNLHYIADLLLKKIKKYSNIALYINIYRNLEINSTPSFCPLLAVRGDFIL